MKEITALGRRWEGETQIACAVSRSLDNGEPPQDLLEKTFYHSETLAFEWDLVIGQGLGFLSWEGDVFSVWKRWLWLCWWPGCRSDH